MIYAATGIVFGLFSALFYMLRHEIANSQKLLSRALMAEAQVKALVRVMETGYQRRISHEKKTIEIVHGVTDDRASELLSEQIPLDQNTSPSTSKD